MDIVSFFSSLSTGARIVWCVLAVIFFFSLYVGITTRGKEGGIAAGIITGLLVHFSVILKNQSLMKWVGGFKYAEWYVVVGLIAGFIIVGAIFAGLAIVSMQPVERSKDFTVRIAAFLFRIIIFACCTLILLFAFLLIGSGGFIAY